MFLADNATQITKEQGITTRKIPYPPGTLLKDIERQKSFYVSCQFHATMLSITDPEYSFLCVFGIEMAAFAMTYVEKDIWVFLVGIVCIFWVCIPCILFCL